MNARLLSFFLITTIIGLMAGPTLHNAHAAQGSCKRELRAEGRRKIECEHYDEPALNGRVSCVAIAVPCEGR